MILQNNVLRTQLYILCHQYKLAPGIDFGQMRNIWDRKSQ